MGRTNLLNSASGFTYISLLLAIVLIGISLSAAGNYWAYIDRRDKEDELLFRGDQFVLAIDGYFKRAHGKANLYPQSLKDLLKDSRSLVPKRYLRKIYKDPLTGKADWTLILEKGSGRIKGVKSKSKATPLKSENFPDRYKYFRGKSSYDEWKFVHHPGIIK